MSMTEPAILASRDQARIEALQRLLADLGRVKVAVSGGVDSLTLGLLAGRAPGCRAVMFHAVSPAVPAAAGARVRETAQREGWDLRLVDARELADEDYAANPYRRCFHCKKNLYATLEAGIGAGDEGQGTWTIVSGTNADDLHDFRPGLQAAERFEVRHPFVECGVDKAAVRRICRRLGYPEIAELPASPCLSSRVQTGLRIEPAMLGFVDRIELLIGAGLRPATVRCRIRDDGICIQLDEDCLAALSTADRETWRRHIEALAEPLPCPARVRFEPYRMGSAFVEPA
jgi:uncharacterized protein